MCRFVVLVPDIQLFQDESRFVCHIDSFEEVPEALMNADLPAAEHTSSAELTAEHVTREYPSPTIAAGFLPLKRRVRHFTQMNFEIPSI